MQQRARQGKSQLPCGVSRPSASTSAVVDNVPLLVSRCSPTAARGIREGDDPHLPGERGEQSCAWAARSRWRTATASCRRTSASPSTPSPRESAGTSTYQSHHTAHGDATAQRTSHSASEADGGGSGGDGDESEDGEYS